jgi:hypothetical protein
VERMASNGCLRWRGLRIAICLAILITAVEIVKVSPSSAATHGGFTAEPAGSYSGSESQNDNGLLLYVSAKGNDIQDLAIHLVALSCTGGFGIGGPAVIDSIKINSDGSFSATASQTGVIAADNYPTTFTIAFEGAFGVTSGTPEASGSYIETATYKSSGSTGSCSSETQTWSVTRKSQPTQPPGVGTAGSYSGTESENGNGMSFKVSKSRTTINKLDFPLVELGCNPGDGGVSAPITLNSLAVSSNGSFSTTFKQVVDSVTYMITFMGHFHGVDTSGASRSAGSIQVTGRFSSKGTKYNCDSNKLWWYASATG